MKVILQPSLRGLSGKMGDWVYRYSKDKEKTFIEEKPLRQVDLHRHGAGRAWLGYLHRSGRSGRLARS